MKLYVGKEFSDRVTVLPEYSPALQTLPVTERLMLLDDIYSIYIPSSMSEEIYCRMGMALQRSIRKKHGIDVIKQRNRNTGLIRGVIPNGQIGGSDSILISGLPGIGKSSAIQQAVRLLSEEETELDGTQIIPVLFIQCPFDCSVKGLLLEILRKVDEELETKYYEYALRSKATADMLIGTVSQVALNHIGILVVDEIQNVVAHKAGLTLVRMLTQLINSSGTSIVMVGTPESESFFEQEEYLARRAVGMNYVDTSYNEWFIHFCRILFDYQYTACRTAIDAATLECLYEYSQGLPCNVVSLIHDAQETAILSGTERLDVDTIKKAFSHRMAPMHTYIQLRNIRGKSVNNTSMASMRAGSVSEQIPIDASGFSFHELDCTDVSEFIDKLRRHVRVVAV